MVAYYSKGCRYMFLRGSPANRFVTLKRIPTPDEISRFVLKSLLFPFYLKSSRFDVSQYPHNFTIIQSEGSKWKEYERQVAAYSVAEKRRTFRDMINSIGDKGSTLLQRLFEVSCECCSGTSNFELFFSGSVF
jgi:hypothetical protein